MNARLLIPLALALVVPMTGRADERQIPQFAARTHVTATGTGIIVANLPSAATLVTTHRESIGPTGWVPHDDTHIASTADTVALVVEQVGVADPIRLLFVSQRVRAGGCLLPDCGRFEQDYWAGGPIPQSSGHPAYSPQKYSLPPGPYTIAIVAPRGATTSATIEVNFGDPVAQSTQTELQMESSMRGQLESTQGEALTSDPVSGTFRKSVRQDSMVAASIASYDRIRRNEDHPRNPMVRLRFNGGDSWVKSGSMSFGSFTWLFDLHTLVRGPVRADWWLYSKGIDRRFSAWLFVWPLAPI